ncbi:MAG TPA: sialidase family protein [Candidatus Thermoplasmatota archaeon]|nr:sialidase family protein [Candidatus Thermoplasmatota archaeon]
MRALSLVVLLLVAGCAAPAGPAPAPAAPARAQEAGWPLHPLGLVGGEPSVGVTSSGAIFVAGHVILSADQAIEERSLAGQLARSTDGGVTWTLVGDVARDPKQNNDPWMWVDTATDRVFNAPLNVACTSLAWSDDDGANWDANPAVACAPPSHDHQKLVTGLPPAGFTTSGYPSVAYYAYNSLLVTGTTGILGAPVPLDERLGTFVSTSLDGGLTFSVGKNIHESDCHRGIVGPPAVAPDGTVYIPHGTCDGVDVMVSRDAGATWDTASLDAVGSLDDFAFDPGVTVDEAGTAYLVWPGADALLYLATSRDAGATWSAPARITPPGVNATVYSSIVATSAGRVAIAYAATTDPTEGWGGLASSEADDDTTWHLWVTLLDGAATRHVRLTSDEDPLQRGCIWMRGGSSDCRNLFDFVTIVAHGDALYLSYTDGCNACASADESTRSDLMLAVSPPHPWDAPRSS